MSGSTLMALVMNIEIKWRDSRGRMGKSGAGYHNMDEGLFNMAEALWSGVPHLNPRSFVPPAFVRACSVARVHDPS